MKNEYIGYNDVDGEFIRNFPEKDMRDPVTLLSKLYQEINTGEAKELFKFDWNTGVFGSYKSEKIMMKLFDKNQRDIIFNYLQSLITVDYSGMFGAYKVLDEGMGQDVVEVFFNDFMEFDEDVLLLKVYSNITSKYSSYNANMSLESLYDVNKIFINLLGGSEHYPYIRGKLEDIEMRLDYGNSFEAQKILSNLFDFVNEKMKGEENHSYIIKRLEDIEFEIKAIL